ncbi:hypothetical protein [Streptococcus equi]
MTIERISDVMAELSESE